MSSPSPSRCKEMRWESQRAGACPWVSGSGCPPRRRAPQSRLGCRRDGVSQAGESRSPSTVCLRSGPSTGDALGDPRLCAPRSPWPSLSALRRAPGSARMRPGTAVAWSRQLGPVPVCVRQPGRRRRETGTGVTWSAGACQVALVLVLTARRRGFAVSRLFCFLCDPGYENLKFLPWHQWSRNPTPLATFRPWF